MSLSCVSLIRGLARSCSRAGFCECALSSAWWKGPLLLHYWLKSERSVISILIKCLELDFCGLRPLSFSLVSVTLSLCEELGFSSLKRKGKCPYFLCASHFSFVYSALVRLFLFPEMLCSAWYLHQRYFNNSNSQSSEAYF